MGSVQQPKLLMDIGQGLGLPLWLTAYKISDIKSISSLTNYNFSQKPSLTGMKRLLMRLSR